MVITFGVGDKVMDGSPFCNANKQKEDNSDNMRGQHYEQCEQ